MEKLIDILAMGGYAAFVWPAYGVAAAIMIFLAIQTIKNQRRTQSRLNELKDRPHNET
jgi:heme exporter protein D